MAAIAESASGRAVDAELRLALVFYGGVSLAIYMHGVTKELHKLVVASRRFDEMGMPRRQRRSQRTGPASIRNGSTTTYSGSLHVSAGCR